MTTLEIPTQLPVDHLSANSISTYLKCPERWRRRYVEREYEPPSGALILGSSVHAAEAHADNVQIESGSRPPSADVQDLFADEWEERSEREEVDWGTDQPGELKDIGVKAISAYDRDIAPSLRPVSVEREFKLDLADVDWGFLGYMDFEEEDGAIVDRKVRGTKMSQAVADTELAVAPYMLARRAEGNPAPEFRFHTFVKTKKPYAEIVPTSRTDAQLDHFVDRLYAVAAEIAWRMESGIWSGAVPGSWWCSERFCGFHSTCPMGGMR
jgi:hypothetical protein